MLLPLPAPDTTLATGIKQYPVSIFKKQEKKNNLCILGTCTEQDSTKQIL